MTQPEDARRMRATEERLSGTYFCHSGKHTVSAAIASSLRRGRRICANCLASIRSRNPKR